MNEKENGQQTTSTDGQQPPLTSSVSQEAGGGVRSIHLSVLIWNINFRTASALAPLAARRDLPVVL